MLKTLLKKIILLLRVIFLSKKIFQKPSQNNFMIYDSKSLVYLGLFLKKKYEIYNVRGEEVNVYLILYTIIKNGFFNFKKNYKFNYFNLVKPKYVITAIDENPGFFLLKDLYKKAIFISFQRSTKKREFFQLLKENIKSKKKVKYKSDFMFVHGESEKKYYDKYIFGKKIISGNLINNHFHKKKKLNSKKEICFISSNSYKDDKKSKNHPDIKLISNLHRLSKERKIDIKFLSKNSLDKKYLKKRFSFFDNFTYISKKDISKTYSITNNANFLVFSNTSLGREAISKGKKGICLMHNFPSEQLSKDFLKKGPFWSNDFSYNEFEKLVDNIFKINDQKWSKKTKFSSNQIIKYDPKNKNSIKMLKKIFKKDFERYFKF